MNRFASGTHVHDWSVFPHGFTSGPPALAVGDKFVLLSSEEAVRVALALLMMADDDPHRDAAIEALCDHPAIAEQVA